MARAVREIPEYSYHDLPEEGLMIRLLKVMPGQKEDFIQCHLEHFSLHDAFRKYECVSYVWGDDADRRLIIVDGHKFEVTLNLFHALQSFRLPDKERWLWADAICIQQSNPPEKGRQVQLMGKIYENSAKTLVWLGPDRKGEAVETVDFLRNLSWVGRRLVDHYGSVKDIPILNKIDSPITQDPRKWVFFENFLRFPWFSRVWVMQEVAIAPDVSMFWGDAEIRFSDIVNVNELQRWAPQLFEVLPMSWYLHDAFVAMYMWYNNKETWRNQVVPDFLQQGANVMPSPNFFDCLVQSSRRATTDPRDYIYALLGHPLAVFEGSTIVQADYTRPLDDVMEGVSTTLLKHLEPSVCLAGAGDMGERACRNLSSDSPSWVIRWELGLETNSLGRAGMWFHSGGKSLEDLKPFIEIDTPNKALKLRAVLFDKVKWFADQMDRADLNINNIVRTPGMKAAVESIWDAMPKEPCFYKDEQGRRDAYTLAFGIAWFYQHDPAEDDMPRHRRIAEAYLEYVQAGGIGNEQLRADARDYENDIIWPSRGRRFILTEKGFYGLGPQLVKEGDVIAVPEGFMVPYVLRPWGKEPGTYKLVGAIFVHGIMRGEVLDAKDPLGLGVGKMEEIYIK